jgi:hypothetical protein
MKMESYEVGVGDNSQGRSRRVAPAVLQGALAGFDVSYPRFASIGAKHRKLVDPKGQIIEITEGGDGKFTVQRRASAESAPEPLAVDTSDRVVLASLIRRAAENERRVTTEDTAITPSFRDHQDFATRFIAKR